MARPEILSPAACGLADRRRYHRPIIASRIAARAGERIEHAYVSLPQGRVLRPSARPGDGSAADQCSARGGDDASLGLVIRLSGSSGLAWKLLSSSRWQPTGDFKTWWTPERDCGRRWRCRIQAPGSWLTDFSPIGQQRLMDCSDDKCTKAVELARQVGSKITSSTATATPLDKLAWLYLNFCSPGSISNRRRGRPTKQSPAFSIAQLEREIDDHEDRPVRSANRKQPRLQILQKRWKIFKSAEQSLQEIESDLTRIDAQVDLAVENAGMSGQPQAVSSNISLVSQLLVTGSLRASPNRRSPIWIRRSARRQV